MEAKTDNRVIKERSGFKAGIISESGHLEIVIICTYLIGPYMNPTADYFL